MGVTIGAGIYVLVGETAALAGIFAPSAFLVAAFVMLFSACSFAELSGRFPSSAGEAVYVDAWFEPRFITLVTGSLVLFDRCCCRCLDTARNTVTGPDVLPPVGVTTALI